MKARGYVRRSIDDPKKGYSVETQQADITKRCAAEGWTLDTVKPFYVDVGGHGWDIARDELVQMLHDAQAHEFDVVVVWRQDRLSRIEHVMLLMRALVWFRVAVATDGPYIDREETLDLLLPAVKAAVSAAELRKMRKATRQGLERAVEKGQVLGRRAAGFKVVDGKFVLNDLGTRAMSFVDKSKGAFAGELGLPPGTAYELKQNLLAYRHGGVPELGLLVMKRSDKARGRERKAEQKAQKKRAEIIAWLEEIVPAKFGR